MSSNHEDQTSSQSSSMDDLSALTPKEEEPLDEYGFVRVNSYLQVHGYHRVFAMGDIININEEKLAQNAEKHADVVVHNIVSMETKRSKMQHYSPATRTIIISLGPRNAIVTYGDRIYLEGKIASKIKDIVEYKTMRNLS
eukprot:gb/GECH01001492.1/.p1 GENE.gb/GECH01001492.1/~~gb/GECH01001492.1/.p1  ORF type:complete len:140 (+),score=42.56 gb/GECH01001492.1/:1-420(+)